MSHKFRPYTHLLEILHLINVLEHKLSQDGEQQKYFVETSQYKEFLNSLHNAKWQLREANERLAEAKRGIRRPQY